MEKTMIVIEVSIIITAILTIVFLNKGNQLARRYQYRKHLPKNHQRLNRVPIKFSTDSILRAGKKFGKNGKKYFAFDTDVLIENPTILQDLSEKYQVDILISEQVRYELNKVKDRKIDVSDQARYVLKVIERLHRDHKLEILQVNKALMRKYSLKPQVQDDQVISSYLEKVHMKDVIFITNDNNARTTARMTDLIPLELDWEIGKKQKEPQFRPGFTFRLLAIISFSLFIGLLSGMNYMKSDIGASHQVFSVISKIAEQSSDEVKAEKTPEEFESEYGDKYKAISNGDWGVSAVINQKFSESRSFGLRLPARIELLFVAYTNDIEAKSNELTYQIETIDGEVHEALYYRTFPYNEEKGIYVESVDSNIQFDSVNSYETAVIEFSVPDFTESDLEGSKLILIHKVTEEVIQTIEL